MRFNRSRSPSPSRVAAVMGNSKKESAPRLSMDPPSAAETQERRRSFAFMKYSTDRRSSKSMNRTREHARKIAMQLSQEASTFNPTFPDAFANINNNTNNNNNHYLDDDDDEDFFQLYQQKQSTSHRRTVAPLPSPASQSLDAEYQQHYDKSSSCSSRHPKAPASPFKAGTTTAAAAAAAPSTPGRLPSLPRSERKKSVGLGQFVEQQQQQQPQRRSSSIGSIHSLPTPTAAAATPPRNSSMLTFPSNSSMQASFVNTNHKIPLDAQSSSASTASITSTGGGGGGGAAGAAARRRMRTRINGKPTNNNNNNHNTTMNTIDDDMMMMTGDAATPPRFFYEPLEDTPPSSPAPKSSDVMSVGSASHRRQQRPSSHSPNPIAYTMRNNSSATTTISSGNSSTGKPPLLPTVAASSPSNGSSNSSADFFLVETGNPGFTFDAFGLDAHEVDNEVNAAMQELAGSHPDWTMMFPSSANEEFPLQQWDSSSQPNSDDRSAPSSPIPTATASAAAAGDGEEEDGFVDGFRLAPPRPMMMMPSLPIHIRQSPTNSERSSLTSNSGAVEGSGRVNVFKQQAGFHSSKRNRHIRSSAGGGAVGPPQQRLQPMPPKQLQQPPLVDEFDFDDDDDDACPETPTSWPPVVKPNDPRLKSIPPNIPSLGETTATVTSDEVTQPDTQHGFRSAIELMSDTGAPSDVFSGVGIPSDAGVMSDVMFNSDFEDVPEEFSMAHKKKNKFKDEIGDMGSFVPREEEEKKDLEEEDDPSNKKVGDLKAAWKKWETRPATTASTPSPGRRPYASISPPYLERKAGDQQQLQQQQQQQQQPLSHQRHRLRPVEQPNRAMSEIGVASAPSPAHLSYLNKIRAAGASRDSTASETKSDVGGGIKGESPRFLAEARLRKTDVSAKFQGGASVPAPPMSTSPESMSAKSNFQRQADQNDRSNSTESSPAPRQLTYRERRELELRKERDERAKAEATKAAEEEQKNSNENRDVASLIRRRIVANRRASNPSSNASTTKELTSPAAYRDKLRPVTSKVSPKYDESLSKDPSNEEEFLHEPYHSVPSEESSLDNYRQRSPDDNIKDSNQYHTPRRSSGEQRDIPQSAPSRMYDDENKTVRHMPAADPSYSTPTRGDEFYHFEERLPHTDKQPRDAGYLQASGYDHERRSNQSVHSPSITQSKSMSLGADTPPTVTTSSMSSEPKSVNSESASMPADSAKAMLNAFLSKRLGPPSLAVPPSRSQEEPMHVSQQPTVSNPLHQPSLSERPLGGAPALKDDPKYDRYFRMLKVGMPLEVVKHAMTRDGMDPTILDGDPNLPAGYGKNIALKDDPRFQKFFKMLRFGMALDAVKHAMESDGVDPNILDQDPNLPLEATKTTEEELPKEKDTHRRARLHWQTLRQVRSNSLWATIDKDPEVQHIEIDEEEFAELFQKEIHSPAASAKSPSSPRKRSVGVRVIDTKRANNGGIILARLRMTHDDLADAVDRIDEDAMTAEQIQNVIEYLPTRDERKALEAYMLEGGHDAAEKFDGLCECEKFMVSMMTVQHAKRKVKALLFKLQFQSCLESLQKDAHLVEIACDELSNSVRLRKLLGIVLTIGNRLNTAGVSSKRKAGAFTLESLLKLNQAKAFDKKTTFLQYVVLVVQRNNELLLRFKDDLPTVLKADRVYWDQVLTDLEEVENQLENVRQMALHQARQSQQYELKKKKHPEDDGNESLSDFSMSLEQEVETLRATPIGLFTLGAIKLVSALREKVEATKLKFAKLLEYFGEEDKALMPHEVFNIIVTFCREFDKARENVFSSEQRKMREQRKRQNNMVHQANGAQRPPMAQPSPSKREQSNNLKVSSHQPNMSAVMKELQKGHSTPKNPSPSTSDPWGQGNYAQSVRGQHDAQFSAATRSTVNQRDAQLQSVTTPTISNSKLLASNGASTVGRGQMEIRNSLKSSPVLHRNRDDAAHSSQGHPNLAASSSFPDLDGHSSISPPAARGNHGIPSSPLLPDVDIPPGMQEQGHLEPVPSDVSSSAISPSPSWSESVKGDQNYGDKSSLTLQQKARWRRQQRLRNVRGSASSSSSVANQSTISATPNPSISAAPVNMRSTSPAKSDTFLVAHPHHQPRPRRDGGSQTISHQHIATSNILELSPRSSIRQKRRNAQRSMKVAQC